MTSSKDSVGPHQPLHMIRPHLPSLRTIRLPQWPRFSTMSTSQFSGSPTGLCWTMPWNSSGKYWMVLCNLLNMKQVRTSPYHPQSNGSVERAHQTLIRMIGKLDPKRKSRWPDHISSICHTYNSTRSQVMGYSPHFPNVWEKAPSAYWPYIPDSPSGGLLREWIIMFRHSMNISDVQHPLHVLRLIRRPRGSRGSTTNEPVQ